MNVPTDFSQSTRHYPFRNLNMEDNYDILLASILPYYVINLIYCFQTLLYTYLKGATPRKKNPSEAK